MSSGTPETQPPSQAPQNASPAWVRPFRVAVAELKAGDVKAAEAGLVEISQAPDLAYAPPQIRYTVYFLLGGCQEAGGEAAGAYATLIKAGEIMPSARHRDYWRMLMVAANAVHEDYVAVDALRNLIADDAASANDIDAGTIEELLDATRGMKDGGIHRCEMLDTLWQVKYAPKNAIDEQTMQSFWSELFQCDVDDGAETKAREVLAEIDSPAEIAGLRADNRYRRFVDGDPRFADSAAVNQRYIADRQALMVAHPRQIGAVEAAANALMETDHLQQALALLDDALAKIVAAPKDQPAFDDLNSNLRWVFDARTRVLARVGRWDEVLAAQTRARDDALAHGEDVVSQRINLGDFLYRLQRSQAALDEVKDVAVADASPYGLMEAEEVRACAYAQLGYKARLRTSLDLMHTHRDEAVEPLRTALQCADDEDGLAALIRERLDDPLTRNAELTFVQTYLPEPHATPYDEVMQSRLHAVLARSDVRAAIARYGVVEAYPLFAVAD